MLEISHGGFVVVGMMKRYLPTEASKNEEYWSVLTAEVRSFRSNSNQYLIYDGVRLLEVLWRIHDLVR